MTSRASWQAAQTADTAAQLEFSRIGRTRVEVVFDEPELSSDGGALLLREAAEANGILDAMAAVITDKRKQSSVHHTVKDLLAQRTTTSIA